LTIVEDESFQVIFMLFMLLELLPWGQAMETNYTLKISLKYLGSKRKLKN